MYYTFSVFLVEGSNIERVCSVDLSSWGNKRWRILLLIYLIPINASEERVILELIGSAAFAT